MTTAQIKTLGVALIISAAIASPIFAQDANVSAPRHVRTHDQFNFRGAYNQQPGGAPYYNAPETREERINQQNFGFSGRSPSRVGGEDPDLNPPR